MGNRTKIIISALILLLLNVFLFAKNVNITEIAPNSSNFYAIALEFKAKTIGDITLYLDGEDENNCIAVTIFAKKILIEQVIDGKKQRISTINNIKLSKAAKTFMTFERAAETLTISVNNKKHYLIENFPQAKGKRNFISHDKFSIYATDVRDADLIYFTDDFMRMGENGDIYSDYGDWDIIKGNWRLRSAWDTDTHLLLTSRNMAKKIKGGQNPFEWTAWGEPAMALIGEEEWKNYTFNVSFRGSAAEFGMILDYKDAKNYLLALITPASAKTSGNVALYSVKNNKKTQLAKANGGYLPNQWYKFTVERFDGHMRVLLDGAERINIKADIFSYGYAGLYVNSDTPIEIDDVKIYSRNVNFDILHELRDGEIQESFLRDPNGMKIWARSSSDWVLPQGSAMASSILTRYYNKDVYGGRKWITFEMVPSNYKNGNIYVLFDSNGKNNQEGYVFEILTEDNRSTINIKQDGVVTASANLSTPCYINELGKSYNEGDTLLPRTKYSMRFMLYDGVLSCSINDEVILSTEALKKGNEANMRPGYRTTGRYLNVSNLRLLYYNTLDYTFSSAPVDWLAEGTFEATTKWSCDPEWSFLAGYSTGQVALWNKNIVDGDQNFRAFLAIKMEYQGQRFLEKERYRDLSIGICSDGHDPLSGYAGIYGKDGNRMVLYRAGVEVASLKLEHDEVPNGDDHHNDWFDLTLNKKGNVITFVASIIDNYNTLEFVDKEPIESGIPVIFSYNNGISIARASLDFRNSIIPQKGPFTSLTLGWYPEYISTSDASFTLKTEAFSTSGGKVALSIAPVILPEGADSAKSALTVNKDNSLSFSPKIAGSYQYEVVASAGGIDSPKAYFDVNVYDPINHKRHAPNAIFKYDFTEGKGNVIRDKSGFGTPVDLYISPKTVKSADGNEIETGELSAEWIKGQGLALDALSKVVSRDVADKLLDAVKKDQRITIEIWLSLRTRYPENIGRFHYVASFLEINDYENSDTYNKLFGLGHEYGTFYFSPHGNALPHNVISYKGNLRNGMEHVVLTYNPEDGKTAVYVNGAALTFPSDVWYFNINRLDEEYLRERDVKEGGVIGDDAYDEYYYDDEVYYDEDEYYDDEDFEDYEYIAGDIDDESDSDASSEDDEYVEEEKYGKKKVVYESFNWRFDEWDKGAKIILGNLFYRKEFVAPVSANIYYLAIYNATFTEENVKNNYKSGPRP